MRESDFDKFCKKMASAFALYDKVLSPEMLSYLFDILCGLSLEEIDLALKTHIETSGYPPKPADIFRIARPVIADNDEASLAWNELQRIMSRHGQARSIVFSGDYALLYLAAQHVGGYRELCLKDTDKLAFKKPEFCIAYNNLKKLSGGKPSDQLYEGEIDRDNIAAGYSRDTDAHVFEKPAHISGRICDALRERSTAPAMIPAATSGPARIPATEQIDPQLAEENKRRIRQLIGGVVSKLAQGEKKNHGA